MAKGDTVNVYFKTGDTFHVHDFVAEQNGRTLDYEFDTEGKAAWLVIVEKTRGGTVIRQARYQTSDVISLRIQKKGIE